LEGLGYLENTVISGFCLDVARVENVASTLRNGIPCQIRRTRHSENSTYFLFVADYVDGCHLYVVIPHPDSLAMAEKQYRLKYNGYAEFAIPRGFVPKIVSWCMSAHNDAGVAYFVVDKFSGITLLVLSDR
jgi:hypothetical protein